MKKAISTPKKKKFVIPSIKEVEDYILEKKSDWPLQFIQWYAVKFWNHYDASGWKLSSGNPVKVWQSCFNAQWQDLKFEAVEMLKKYTVATPVKKIVIEKKNGQFTPEFMDQVLAEYKKNYATITDETLCSYYSWMKERSFIKLTKEEIEQVRGLGLVKGPAACVRISFMKMVNYQVKFTDAKQL